MVSLRLPYSRPRLIEIHEQDWCPPYVRQPVQELLTFLWTHRIPPFQPRAPYEVVVEVLDRVIDDIEREDEQSAAGSRQAMRIVDCCSGAGGPMPLVEQKLNQRRKNRNRDAVPVLLSDIHPYGAGGKRPASNPASKSLSYFPSPVDARQAPVTWKGDRYLRTFNLAFHHFGEEDACRILEDTMRTSEGIGIFEMQSFDIGSIITILALFPLVLLITPFTKPTFRQLLLTYLLPVIPFVLVVDGLVSAWRTRTTSHLLHLSDLAAMRVNLESGDKQVVDWRWEHGGTLHTWPCGRLHWAVGRRDRHPVD